MSRISIPCMSWNILLIEISLLSYFHAIIFTYLLSLCRWKYMLGYPAKPVEPYLWCSSNTYLNPGMLMCNQPSNICNGPRVSCNQPFNTCFFVNCSHCSVIQIPTHRPIQKPHDCLVRTSVSTTGRFVRLSSKAGQQTKLSDRCSEQCSRFSR